MDIESDTPVSIATQKFPPGTAPLTDIADSRLILSPQPTNDPNDPLNWSSHRKTIHIILLTFYNLFSNGFTTISTVVWSQMNDELGFAYTDLNYSYATSAAALSVGCIFFTPLAMRFGKRPVYLLTSAILVAGEVWSARMMTITDLYITNIIMGLAGSVWETLFQMTVHLLPTFPFISSITPLTHKSQVSDMYFVHQRGSLNGIFIVGSVIGSYLAPVATGYIAESQDWRWSFWYLAIFQGVTGMAMIFFLEETKYAPDNDIPGLINPSRLTALSSASALPQHIKGEESASLEHPAPTEKSDPAAIYQVITDGHLHNGRVVQINHDIPTRPLRRRYGPYNRDGAAQNRYEWWRHFTQPFVLIATIPAAGFAALQWAFVLAAISLVAVSTADLYTIDPYNFGPIGIGNLNYAPAIGATLGCIYGGPFVDWVVIFLAKRNGGIYEPEMRLVPFALPAVVMPIGVLMYGLTTAEGQAWIVPTIGSGLIGFGIGGVGDIALTYLQDSYNEILPDALVGVAFLRNALSTVLIFVIQPWFDGMGVYNAFVMLGCFAVAFSFLGIPMGLYGKRARVKCADRYRRYAAKQFIVRAL